AWRQDPDLMLNDRAFANPRVLIAGPDFGARSSREHAVWTPRDFGFAAVLAPRFGDTFRGNAGKQGLLAGQSSEDDAKEFWRLIDASPGISATVDLEARTATIGTHTVAFQIDDYTRWRLLEGLDDIGLTLREEEKITRFEGTRESWRPLTLPIRQAR